MLLEREVQVAIRACTERVSCVGLPAHFYILSELFCHAQLSPADVVSIVSVTGERLVLLFQRLKLQDKADLSSKFSMEGAIIGMAPI